MSRKVDEIYSGLREAYSNKLAAVNQAKSLKIISSDIYTEEDRFVYELLQNAIDAFADVHDKDTLNVKIVRKDDLLIFMHNGAEFTDSDVEGICGIGNGTKTNNAKKIGYKGIGFKSVFAHSDEVTMLSGEHCFKFDKAFWKKQFEHDMPWQIIPINQEAIDLEDTDGYNVATFIRLKNSNTIEESIRNMFSRCDFLLFLGCKNAEIDYYTKDTLTYSLRKETAGDTVNLYISGSLDSSWLIHNVGEEDAIIPTEVKQKIADDENTPSKLKESDSYDLSIAIKLNNNGIIEPLKHSVLYTYLPTSVSLGFHFLINANFITDAGRQQLHRNSEWNKFLISRIPETFLGWMATISTHYPEYYKLLPKHFDPNTPFAPTFNKALDEAIEEIAFIPSQSLEGTLLKSDDAFIDRIGIATEFATSSIAEHINRTYTKSFTESSLINNRGISIFKEYGVFIFDKDCFKNLFEDQTFFDGISNELDVRLIHFLHRYYVENQAEQADLLTILTETPFLLTEDGSMETPRKLFFPQEFYEADEFITQSKVLNSNVYDAISSTNDLLPWLELLGVSKKSNISVIENLLCSEDYITEDNALDVVRFIFETYKREDIFEEVPSYTLDNLRYLTQNGRLLPASELYLGSHYRPETDLERYCEEDIFISDEYDNENDAEEWRLFFKKMGVASSIELTTRTIDRRNSSSYFALSGAIESSEQVYYTSYDGRKFYFYCSSFKIKYFPILKIDASNEYHQITKIILSDILSKEKPTIDLSEDLIIGSSGLYNRTLDLRQHNGGNVFLDYTIRHQQHFPTTDGRMLTADEVFLNSQINVALAGKYLPVLDIDCAIDESWLDCIRFKLDLTLTDLLQVLTNISNDASGDKVQICQIYKRIIEISNLEVYSVRLKIEEWGRENKILSKSGEFKNPQELSLITIEGFNSSQIVYTGDIVLNRWAIKLFSLMGVRVITKDNVKPSRVIINKDYNIVEKLKTIISPLAILQSDSESNGYSSAKDTLYERISNAEFYKCSSINLTYGNEDDVIPKKTFALDHKFYYVGDLKASKLEPLLTPLCSFLGLEGKERELFVLLIEDDEDAIKDYLVEMGYSIDMFESPNTPALTTLNGNGGMLLGGIIGDGIETQRRIEESKEVKALVKQRLVSEGYDYSNASEEFSVISGIMKGGQEYPLVVKSCKNAERTIMMNPTEWAQLLRPNSMLWLHFGGGLIAPIRAFDLFTYQDKLTLSFGTQNLYKDERVRILMKLMYYFNDVHLNLTSLVPGQGRGEALKDYAFNNNNLLNSDTDSEDDSVL